MFKFFLYKLGQFIVNRLPIKVAYCLAMVLSKFQYYCSPRDRKAVQDNLRQILGPEAPVFKMGEQVFCNFGKYLVEFFRMAHDLDDAFIREKVVIHNWHRIPEALARGKGVVLLTGHIGNWEMGGLLVSLLGYPLYAIAMPHKERPVNELFNEQRRSKGVEVVPMPFAVRKCLKVLKENKIVAVLADRDFSKNGEMLDFLGRKAFIPKGAAVFSSKTGAAIMPMFLIRQENDTFILEIEEPIYPESLRADVDPDGVIFTLMKKYTGVLERKIRQHPDQWLMFRRFWIQEPANP